jgi:hypothetical protein
MDGERFDRLGQALGNRSKTHRPLGALLGFALAGSRAVPLAAQDDIATAGSGGYATASSSGGAVGIGDVNSGGNVGNAVAVGDTYGAVWVDGGDVANSTSIGVSADGGTAIADASGGSYNVAFVS